MCRLRAGPCAPLALQPRLPLHDPVCRLERAPSLPGGDRRRWSENCPVVSRPTARNVRRRPSQVLPQTPEERMPDFPFRRLGAVLDLCQELRLRPDAPVSDPLRVRLRLADQRFQSLLQVGRGRLVETVVNLARLDEG